MQCYDVENRAGMWELDTQKNALSSGWARKTTFNDGSRIMQHESLGESEAYADLSLFSTRLAALKGGIPVARFSRECGVNESAMRSYLTGKSEPGLFNLRRIAEYKKCSLDWLCERASVYPVDQGGTVLTSDGAPPRHEARSDPDHSDFAYLPLYDIAASSGAGKWNETARIKSWLAFRRDWLLTTVGTTTGLSLVSNFGDSMYPTVPDSSVVMVRDIDSYNFNDGIYLMLLNGAHVLKRAQRASIQVLEFGRTEIQVTVLSDNSNYQPITATLRDETLHETNVLARAVWYGVKLA